MEECIDALEVDDALYSSVNDIIIWYGILYMKKYILTLCTTAKVIEYIYVINCVTCMCYNNDMRICITSLFDIKGLRNYLHSMLFYYV